MRGRNRFVVSFCVLALAAALPAAAQNPNCTPGAAPSPPPNQVGLPLRQPDEFCSRGVRYCPGGDRSLAGPNGIRPTLEMQYFRNVSVGSKILGLRMYGYPFRGGMKFTLPAPTYRVRIGETIDLTYRNCLMAAPPSPIDQCNPRSRDFDTFPNCYHADNITNFHFHGFHISPKANHDDVFLKLAPGDPDYAITSGPIPNNQAPGTHWYHPHNHGSTALQVANGMAGAFLVEGPFDDFLHEYYQAYGGLEERLMIIQDISDATPFPPGSTTQRPELLVNGQRSPVVSIAPGQVQRWRFIGGTMKTLDDVRVRFPAGFEVRQVALDGIQFHQANYLRQPLLRDSEFRLAPGNRADFLVRAPGGAGAFDVLYQVEDPRHFETEVRTLALHAEAEPLFSIEIAEPPAEEGAGLRAAPAAMPFPPSMPVMPPFLNDIPRSDVRRDRTVVFSMVGNRGSPADPGSIVRFYIDGKKFDHDCIDQRMIPGAVEEWLIQNTGKSNVRIQHPAHIHVNPFQVVARNGQALDPPWIWQDTVALPLWTDTQPGSVTIRHRFESFTGKYVMHCHILGHEDRGMMQLLEVGNESGLPLCKDKPPTAGEGDGHSHGGH